MEKQVDFIELRTVIDAETGDAKVERTTGHYTAHVDSIHNYDAGKIDPKNNDPTLASFHEPKADDEQGDG